MELLERVWEFSLPQPIDGGEPLSVAQRMEEVRATQRGHGVPHPGREQFWYERVLERWKQLPHREGVPASWWEFAIGRFATKVVASIDFSHITTDLVDGMGRQLYEELVSLRSLYPKSGGLPDSLNMIDIFPTEQIFRMIQDYGRALTAKAAHFSDPITAAKRFQANRLLVEEVLRSVGHEDLISEIVWRTKICFEEDRAKAVERALAIARELRLHPRERGKGPPTPPTVSAGGGETDLAVAGGPSSGGGGKMERGILDISRGLGGFVTITAPFVGLDVAEHHHLISSGQKTLIVGGLMGVMTYLDRMTPGHLALLYAPFEMGRITVQKGLKAAGIPETSLWYKAGGTVGAFAGAEGFVTWVGKGAGASTLQESHLLGRQVLHDSLLNIGRNVQESLGVVRYVVARSWRMMTAAIPTVAEARLIGAALATGLVNFGGRLITPLILPMDALSVFPQRRGPSI